MTLPCRFCGIDEKTVGVGWEIKKTPTRTKVKLSCNIRERANAKHVNTIHFCRNQKLKRNKGEYFKTNNKQRCFCPTTYWWSKCFCYLAPAVYAIYVCQGQVLTVYTCATQVFQTVAPTFWRSPCDCRTGHATHRPTITRTQSRICAAELTPACVGAAGAGFM